MQIQVFSIPMEGDEEATAQLNLFLRTHKVLCIEKAPVIAQGRQYWSVCVEFLPRRPGSAPATASGSANTPDKPKIDYRQILTPPEFSRFSKLRQLRKQLADSEAVPVYALFTNAQLADMARKVPKSKAALGEVEGLGEAKIGRYADVLLGLLTSLPAPEAPVTEPTTAAEPKGELVAAGAS
jgi:superfamily II DNA helicase RecQ